MKIIVSDISDAIRKNGLVHVRGSLFNYDKERNRIGGCALGQALYNLEKIDISKYNILHSIYKSPVVSSEFNALVTMMSQIISMNDQEEYSLDHIADVLDKRGRETILYSGE